MRLSAAPFHPDLPALVGGSAKGYNVIPVRGLPLAYRPVAGLTVYASNALATRCQGAASFLDNSGNAFMFAGTDTKLYELTSGSTAFADVSGATYTTATDGRWNFAGYGNQIAAFNYTDANQLFTLGVSATFGNLAAASPKARYGAIIKNFLVLANTTDGTFGAVPYGLWWSKQGDITTWPTPGTDAARAALSDRRELAGDTGWIQGIVGGLSGADGCIVSERGMFRMTFIGGDQVFNFDLVEGARGTPAPGSLIVDGGVLYYLGENGFYATNGIASNPIGAGKFDKFFFSDTVYGVDQANFFRMSAISDPINKVVMWAYPSVSSSGGSLDTVLVYNWDLGEGSLINGLEALELMMPIRSLGYTADSADALGTVDTFPYSPDSRQLTGGRYLIGAFDTSHTLKTFTGANLAATYSLGEQSHPSGERMGVTEVWPLVDGTSVTATFTPSSRNRQNDAAVAGTAVAQNATGFCPVRMNARYVGGDVTIAAGGTWTQAVGADIPDESIALLGGR